MWNVFRNSAHIGCTVPVRFNVIIETPPKIPNGNSSKQQATTLISFSRTHKNHFCSIFSLFLFIGEKEPFCVLCSFFSLIAGSLSSQEVLIRVFSGVNLNKTVDKQF